MPVMMPAMIRFRMRKGRTILNRHGPRTVGDAAGRIGPLPVPLPVLSLVLGLAGGLAPVPLIVLSAPSEVRAATVVLNGVARVIDGDTLELQGERVRLHGIDAPETHQRCRDPHGQWYACGQQATARLRSGIGNRPVTCTVSTRDRYGRVIGVCHADGVDLNARLVREGLALAYRRYSSDYIAEEAQARAGRHGVWAGSFVAPWDWRKGVR